MLKLSKKTDYALVALSHLQATDAAASAKEIARCYDLSQGMLANVLKQLATAGLLDSKRGQSGGYSLGREPNDIFVGEIIDAIEGKHPFSDCTNIARGCAAESCCPARGSMLAIHKKLKTFLNNLSLADIADKEALASFAI